MNFRGPFVDEHLVVVGAEPLGDLARVLHFLKASSAAKPTVKVRTGRVGALAHQRDVVLESTPAGQKHAVGHVGHHAFADRLAQHSTIVAVASRSSVTGTKGCASNTSYQRAATFAASVRVPGQCPGGSLSMPLNIVRGAGVVMKGQVMKGAELVHRRRDRVVGENGLDLRANSNRPPCSV
jgi:hypothetical protein